MRFISIAKIVILSFFFVSIFCNTQVWAAELIRQNEVTVNSEQTNLYINGNNVVVKSPTKKDLNVTAFSFNLNAPVERNLNVAASEVTINSVVDGSVKIVGGNIKLSGVFKEDVVIIGGQLDIREAVIEGDLIVGVVNLNIHSSKIKGNLIGNYSICLFSTLCNTPIILIVITTKVTAFVSNGLKAARKAKPKPSSIKAYI